jgi:hypothetical protein
LREKDTVRVFENKVLRRIFGHKRRKQQEAGENCITSSFIICIPRKILLERSNEGGRGREGQVARKETKKKYI